MAVSTDLAYQQCLNPACRATFDVGQTQFACPACGDLLDVVYDWDRLPVPRRLERVRGQVVRPPRPAELLGRLAIPRAAAVRAPRDGRDHRRGADAAPGAPTRWGSTSALAPGGLRLQYEGMNPSGSFKDNGMTAAFTHARMVGARRVACASTGNTSAALAVYCSATDLGFKAIIFIGSGKIAYGKLAQALDHGALTIQIVGDFDDAMQRVRQVADRLGIYLMNSVNPFRLEGQKTIMYRVLEALALGGPRLDRRAGRQPGQLERLRQGVHRAEAPRPDRPRAPAGGDQRRTAPARSQQLVGEHGLTWRDGLPDMDRAQAYYDRLDADAAQGLDDRLGDRDQPPGEPQEVPAGARLLRRRGARRSSDQEIMDAKARVGAGGLGASPPAPPASPAPAGSARRG